MKWTTQTQQWWMLLGHIIICGTNLVGIKGPHRQFWSPIFRERTCSILVHLHAKDITLRNLLHEDFLLHFQVGWPLSFVAGPLPFMIQKILTSSSSDQYMLSSSKLDFYVIFIFLPAHWIIKAIFSCLLSKFKNYFSCRTG